LKRRSTAPSRKSDEAPDFNPLAGILVF